MHFSCCTHTRHMRSGRGFSSTLPPLHLIQLFMPFVYRTYLLGVKKVVLVPLREFSLKTSTSGSFFFGLKIFQATSIKLDPGASQWFFLNFLTSTPTLSIWEFPLRADCRLWSGGKIQTKLLSYFWDCCY